MYQPRALTRSKNSFKVKIKGAEKMKTKIKEEDKKEIYTVITKKYDGSEKLKCWFSSIRLTKDFVLLESKNDFTYQLAGKPKRVITHKTKLFVFFDKWFNVFVFYGKDEKVRSAYCNIATPIEMEKKSFHYIDLDLDVIVKQNFSIKIIDQDEFEQNKDKYNYPGNIIKQANNSIAEILSMVKNRKFPFNWNDESII